MIKLDRPSYSFQESLGLCLSGIPDTETRVSLKQKLISNEQGLLAQAVLYESKACSAEIYSLTALIAERGDDPSVIGDLTKSELTSLYSDFFRDSDDKHARQIYDYIKTSSGSVCPFCCGVNKPNQVDHFLPKAHYPQFSVAPDNLIPACQYCNEDFKKQYYAETKLEQIIQPYFDNDKYFNEQWVFADYVPENAGEPHHVNYYVRVPGDWSEEEEFRVNKHFELFDLAIRFREKSDQLLPTVMSQVESHQENPALDNELIIQCAIEPGINNAPFINHWQRAMFMAVKNYLLKENNDN